MKLLKNLSLFSLLILLLLTSCRDEMDDLIPLDFNRTEISEVLINASLNGTVIDEEGNALEAVLVRVNGRLTQTDEFGVFALNNITMDQNGAVVSVEKDGYFESTKVVMTSVNQTSHTEIMLIEKILTASFNASTGGTSSMNGGATVDIPAAGVRLESGGAYSGNVNVYATYLDPTSSDLTQRMPGDLRATNSENEAMILETYGMIGVELESDSGEKLNIADGQTATIEIPVPSSLMGTAPATIPLWHFDEESGYWIEEGEATLTSNDTYVGTVSHFSFWNCDVPYPLVKIEGLVKDDRDFCLSSVRVEISLNSSGRTAYGYTDNDGKYEGLVPKDEELTLEIYDDCGGELYSAQIGPFGNDAIIPTINISANSGNFLQVTGSLVDCDNDVESNGYVLLEFTGAGHDIIVVNADGSFDGLVNTCNEMEVTISGISSNPFSQGTTTLHDITGATELNVGTLISCW
jgi:hypothetical protein